MSAVKRKGGYKIKLESGKILPKIFLTKAAADKRIKQLKRFRKK